MKDNKTVVITGGGKGIGADISKEYYSNGYFVIIGSRKDSGLAKELGNRAFFHETDVRKPSELKALMEKAVSLTGRLDVLVNNAGYSGWRPLRKIEESFWNDMIDTNLKGVLFGCQCAVEHLSPGGSIVNISSLAGKRGSLNNSVYCASKFGVNGITQALAKELGPENIRVNAVCPVFVKTEGVIEALKNSYSPVAGSDVDSFLESFKASQSALLRLPSGMEVAKACVFLSSDKASAITGQCINVDCGVLPQ